MTAFFAGTETDGRHS